jgi:hypothetical protein
LEQLRPDLPPDLVALIRKMMAKDPNTRFQTPAELLAALPVPEATSLDEPLQTVLPEPSLDLTAEVVGGVSRPPATVRSRSLRPSVVSIVAVGCILAAAVGAYVALNPNAGAETAKNQPPQQDSPPATVQSQTPAAATAPVAQPTPQPNSIYLSSLTELDVVVGVGRIGKQGRQGYGNANPAVKVGGVHTMYSLSIMPPPRKFAHVRYELNGRYRMFSGAATISDSATGPASSELIFIVKGDGKTLWTSQPIKGQEQAQKFAINVKGVRNLELEIHCPGSNNNAHAIWFEPLLQP